MYPLITASECLHYVNDSWETKGIRSVSEALTLISSIFVKLSYNFNGEDGSFFSESVSTEMLLNVYSLYAVCVAVSKWCVVILN